jgi:hypothetical protein
MSDVPLAAFVEGLRRGRVLTADRLAALDRDLMPRSADADALARKLVRRGWLTAWQADREDAAARDRGFTTPPRDAFRWGWAARRCSPPPTSPTSPTRRGCARRSSAPRGPTRRGRASPGTCRSSQAPGRAGAILVRTAEMADPGLPTAVKWASDAIFLRDTAEAKARAAAALNGLFLAMCHHRKGQFAKAEGCYRRAAGRMKRQPVTTPPGPTRCVRPRRRPRS